MPRVALAKQGYLDMHYVYLLRSVDHPNQKYSGVTDDLKKRLAEHNAGKSIHTNRFKPWRLITYIAFDTRKKAEEFEIYLKQGTDHAFVRKHFWLSTVHNQCLSK